MLTWDPFTVLARLDSEFDDLVRRSFGARTMQYTPPVDMFTDGADVLICMELPGVSADDVDLEVANGRLTVVGERKDHVTDDRGRLLVRELRYGSFQRSFQLPEGVDAGRIEAEFDAGLLRIRIRDVTKPVPGPRRIAVRSAGEVASCPAGALTDGKAADGASAAGAGASAASPQAATG